MKPSSWVGPANCHPVIGPIKDVFQKWFFLKGFRKDIGFDLRSDYNAILNGFVLFFSHYT